ncbi:MAG: hypothetical protein JWP76_3377 [Dactylosporangium sp.]|jgi:hypothetical protein|nr:hypothetical protein [Dactylosporangium sp.]
MILCLAGLGVPARAGAADPAPPAGSFGVRLLEAPVNRRSDPRARTEIVDHLSPGTVIHRRVLVANKSPERQHIEVYPAAATVGKGQFQVRDGHANNELTSWISVDGGSLDMQPWSEVPVQVTVQVPATASTGERYAVVWAAMASKPDPSANINLVNRVGIRVYLDVGPGGEPPSDFTIGEVIAARDKHGQPSVTIAVRNTGGRALDMSGNLSLSDGPAGVRAGPFEVVKGTTLAPGESGRVAVQFPRELSNGPWKMEVNLASGMVNHTATGRIRFPDAGQTGKPSLLSGLGAMWATVGASLGVGLVTVTGLAFTFRRGRRRAAARGR